MKSLFRHMAIVSVFIVGLLLVASSLPARAVAAPHKIKAGDRLYDSVTGNVFQPRGINYVRLARTADGSVFHSTFEPGRYNPTAARAFLNQVQFYKYNTVRVFIDPGGSETTPHGMGRGIKTYDVIYSPYMDNFADFVNEAAARNIYVLPSIDFFPSNGYYWNFVGANQDGFSTTNIGGRNLSYMDRGRIMAKAEYMKQFTQALKNRVGANEAAILAYQADNEFLFETNQPPFYKLTGTVRPVDGVVYDMSKPEARQQAADASMVMYANLVKQKLTEANPGALLTIGFFTNQAVGKTSYNGLTTTYCSTNCKTGTNYWVPGRPAALSVWGKVDFLDIHIYPNTSPYNLAAELKGLEESSFKKPYIVGEFGARKTVYASDITKAAFAMRDFRVASCKEGAQGWLFWTWDSYENMADQPSFFKLTENNLTINNQLAPGFQPDPCSTTSVRMARKVVVSIALPQLIIPRLPR